MCSALRSARLPVILIGSPIDYANRLIGSPVNSQSTAGGAAAPGSMHQAPGGTFLEMPCQMGYSSATTCQTYIKV